jgi:hypothetical protein
MINALFSNPTWDDSKNNREERITELNKNFDDAITMVRDPTKKREKDINWQDPWWAAAKRGMEKTRIEYGLDPEGRTAKDLIEYDEEQMKQLQARRSSLDSLDQS